MTPPIRLIVMGVSGCGKSHVGQLLADQLDAAFLDGDDFHPQANRDKMAGGQALTDDDRWPWLDRLAEQVGRRDRVVLACSALRRVYRDRLRSAAGVRFVYLEGSFELIERRMQQRENHFMPVGLLRSQFDALERPAEDEHDVVCVSIDSSVDRVVAAALEQVGGAC